MGAKQPEETRGSWGWGYGSQNGSYDLVVSYKDVSDRQHFLPRFLHSSVKWQDSSLCLACLVTIIPSKYFPYALILAQQSRTYLNARNRISIKIESPSVIHGKAKPPGYNLCKQRL